MVKEEPLFSKVLSHALIVVLTLGVAAKYCPSRPTISNVAELQGTMHDQAQEAWNGLEGSCGPRNLKLPGKACDAARRAVEKAKADDCPGAHAALEDMNAPLAGLTVPDLAAPRVFQAQMLSALSSGCGSYELKPEASHSP